MSARETAPSKQRGPLSDLLRQMGAYTTVPLFQRAVAILVVPILTLHLSTAQFGAQEMLDLVILVAIELLALGIFSGMTRFYFVQENDRDRAAVITSSILALVVGSGVVVLAIWLVRDRVAPLLFEIDHPDLASDDLLEVLTLSLLVIPCTAASSAGFEYLKIRRRAGLYASLQLTKLVVEVALKIFLLVSWGWGLRALVVGTLVGEGLCALLLTGGLFWRLGARFDGRVFRPMLVFSLPLIPAGLCELILHQFDRYLLRRLYPPGGELEAMDALGLYGLGYRLGRIVIAVLLVSLLRVWQPWIFGVQDERQRADLLRRGTVYALAAIAAGSIVLIASSRQLVHLLVAQDSYLPAAPVVPIIAAAYVLWALYLLARLPLMIARRSMPILWMSLAAVALNVGLNTWLVPAHGYLGAAYATAGTFGALAVLGLWQGQRHMGEARFDLARVCAVLMLVAIAMAGTAVCDQWVWAEEPWAFSGMITKAGVALLCLATLWLGVLTPDERRSAGSALRS